MWLALVLAFASLVPLGAQVLNSRQAAMACCRKKGGECCPRHAPAGRAFTANSCSGDCCVLAPGVQVRASGAVLLGNHWTPAIRPVGQLPSAPVSRTACLSSPTLRQRPPPPILFL